ncbi:ABC transporter substrate-binding protein [Vibrio sp.]|nr:ABC transporter substrate-binding protein [Vibrio sp.]
MKNFKLNTLFKYVSMGSLALSANVFAAGNLTVAIPHDAGSWDPVDTFKVAWSTVANNIYDGLIERDVNLNLQPALAEKWEMMDNNMRIRFTLRQGVTFHNGEAFNAESVKFTFDRLLGEQGKAGPQRSNYTTIEKVAVVDEYTIDFFMNQVDPVILTKLAGYGSMIVPPKYIAEHGEDHFNHHPVGTGPFKMTAYKPKVSVEMARFDNFWGEKADIDTIKYRFIKEDATRVAELESGRVDIIDNVPVALVPQLNESKKSDLVGVSGPTTYAFRLNTKNGITKDPKVRKALTLAIDRQTIIDSILMGQAKMISSFQSDMSFGYDESISIDPYDPTKAMALLKEAGIKPGTEIEISYRSENSTFSEVAQAVAGYLSIVGINAKVKPYETGIYLSDVMPNGKTGEMFQSSWGGWTFDYDNTAYLMYHTGERWNAYDSYIELDKMLNEQRNHFEPEKRLPILHEIANFVKDEYIEIPMYSLKTLYGVGKHVQNFEGPADNRFRFNKVKVQ